MATQIAPKRAFDSPSIPDRLYFKIGDVARLCEVETYVLRFWETKFPQLKPNKSGTGQRLYRRRDVEMALEIKRLVHGQGFTLAGARQALAQGNRRGVPHLVPQPKLPLPASDSAQSRDSVASAIGRIRAELREIAGLLSAPEPQPPRRRCRLAALPDSPGFLFPA
jgi:DNA-binding transcriptional MerR regulator